MSDIEVYRFKMRIHITNCDLNNCVRTAGARKFADYFGFERVKEKYRLLNIEIKKGEEAGWVFLRYIYDPFADD